MSPKSPDQFCDFLWKLKTKIKKNEIKNLATVNLSFAELTTRIFRLRFLRQILTPSTDISMVTFFFFAFWVLYSYCWKTKKKFVDNLRLRERDKNNELKRDGNWIMNLVTLWIILKFTFLSRKKTFWSFFGWAEEYFFMNVKWITFCSMTLLT